MPIKRIPSDCAACAISRLAFWVQTPAIQRESSAKTQRPAAIIGLIPRLTTPLILASFVADATPQETRSVTPATA
jgi:hypothetical protein